MSNPSDVKIEIGQIWHDGTLHPDGTCRRFIVTKVDPLPGANFPAFVTVAPLALGSDKIANEFETRRLDRATILSDTSDWHGPEQPIDRDWRDVIREAAEKMGFDEREIANMLKVADGVEERFDRRGVGYALGRVQVPKEFDLDEVATYMAEIARDEMERAKVLGSVVRRREERKIERSVMSNPKWPEADAVLHGTNDYALLRQEEISSIEAEAKRGGYELGYNAAIDLINSKRMDTDGVNFDMPARLSTPAAEIEAYGPHGKPDGRALAMAIRMLIRYSHGNSLASGWWPKLMYAAYESGERVGRNESAGQRNFGELLALIHSELSESLEGYRKGKKDEHLPQQHNYVVELADALHRIFDLAGAMNMPLATAYVEKGEFNLVREDHKLENRSKPGGKAF